jgi:SAM-dependent methyltransferase
MSYESFAYVYDRLMRDAPYGEWIRFAEAVWDKYGRPRTVADLGCGTGNIAIPLAESGMRVFGIDLSEDMLAVARAKEEERLGGAAAFPSGGALMWLHQDLREWQLPEPVDCALSFCDCLNYLLEEEDIVRTFRQTHSGLRPGGLFLFDVHTPRQLSEYAEEQPFVLDDDDIAYIWTCDYDSVRNEIEHHLTIFTSVDPLSPSLRETRSGSGLYRRLEETHVQRAYDLHWLERQLYSAGFGEVACYADFSLQPPTAGTQRAFFAARRG